MKLSDLAEVHRWHQHRADLERDILLVVAGNKALGVTIAGRYQDEAVVDAVTRVVAAELERRLADADARLEALGVDVRA